jgi:ankyrin
MPRRLLNPMKILILPASFVLSIGFATVLPAAEIHEAAAAGDVARITAMVKGDSTLLQSADKAGDRPLHHAVRAKHLEAVECLLKLGADANAAGFDGWTPLHLAAKLGPTDAVMALLKAGARTDVKNGAGQTPLQVAAHELIRQQLRQSASAPPGTDAFHEAAVAGDVVKLETLAKAAPALVKEAAGVVRDTALHAAVRAGQLAAARWLVEQGADVDALNGVEESPILLATASEHVEMVELLLKSGANPDPPASQQQTPLQLAVFMVRLDDEELVQSSAETVNQLKDAKDPHEKRRAQDQFDVQFGPLIKSMRDLTEEQKQIRLKIVSLLLDHRADPNRQGLGALAQTPLSFAAMCPDAAAVRLLLARGADPNAGNGAGGTPLAFAVMGGREEAVDALLEAGAAVVGLPGGTRSNPPLGLALKMGREDMALRLLQRGKPSKLVLETDAKLAWTAGQSRNPALVRHLLDAGMSVRAATEDLGQTALHSAAIHSIPEVVGMLLDAGAELERVDKARFTPLHCAVEANSMDNVKRLLERGAKVNVSCYDGRSPLYTAVQFNFFEMGRLLLENGAEANAACDDGRAALHVAAQSGLLDMVRLLLANGASVQLKASGAATPLHYAVFSGNVEVLQLLIEKGGDLESRAADQRTPLIIAAQIGQDAMVECLLKAGANPKSLIPDKEGQLSLVHVCLEGRLMEKLTSEHVTEQSAKATLQRLPFARCIELLAEAGTDLEFDGPVDGRTALGMAAEQGLDAEVEVLLRHGARMDNFASDTQKRLPLHRAAAKGHAGVVRILLKAGAKDSPSGVVGAHSMHLAAQEGHLEVVTTLLDAGWEVNVRDAIRATPLHVAALAGQAKVVALLLERGADLTAVMTGGFTAPDVARKGGHNEVETLLMKAKARKTSGN